MMTTPETRRAQIEALRLLPDQLEAVIAGWTDEQLDFRPSDSEWSARQIVHHLADSHAQSHFRIKMALVEQTPTITPYDQDKFAALPDYTLPLEPALAIIRGVHARFVVTVERMSDADYLREFYHPEQGRNVPLWDALVYYSEHGALHVQQILRNKAAGGW